ncbi:MAG: hypothetical protein M1457_14370 [bacterium]|nr:hypothetical protein [bacterium]
MGSGDLEEACRWVEYCRGSDRQPPARIWGLGNELFGPWQVGYCTGDEYGRNAQQFAQFMRVVAKDLEFVGVGFTDPDWNARVLGHCGQYLNWLSIHLYAHQSRLDGDNDFDVMMATPAVFEDEIQAMTDQLAEYERKAERSKPIAICLEEWCSRHRIKTKIVRESPRNIADALFVAGIYNVCHRHCPRVTMANYTFPVNLHAPIEVSETGVLRSATFDVHRLYATKMQPVAIEARWNSERFSAEVSPVGYQCSSRRVTADRLDVSATRSADGRRFAIAVLNRHASQPVAIALRLKGQPSPKAFTLHTLTSPDLLSVNTWDEPEKVRSHEQTITASSGVLTLPPHSVNVIECEKPDQTG